MPKVVAKESTSKKLPAPQLHVEAVHAGAVEQAADATQEIKLFEAAASGNLAAVKKLVLSKVNIEAKNPAAIV